MLPLKGDRQELPRRSGSATCLLKFTAVVPCFAAAGAMQSIQHLQPRHKLYLPPDVSSFGADIIGRWRRPRYPSPPRNRGFAKRADERSHHQAPKGIALEIRVSPTAAWRVNTPATGSLDLDGDEQTAKSFSRR